MNLLHQSINNHLNKYLKVLVKLSGWHEAGTLTSAQKGTRQAKRDRVREHLLGKTCGRTRVFFYARAGDHIYRTLTQARNEP